MPDIHVPKLDEDEPQAVSPATAHSPHRTHLFKLALEVALISLGVFLGLAGEQFRESAHHRELAEDSLRRFREELIANRRSVASVEEYHVNLKRAIDEYLAQDRGHRKPLQMALRGIQPASFERTAWDLAIATQALEYVDSSLAYSLAGLYNMQQNYSDLTRGVVQAMYIRPPGENPDAFLESLQVYYGDIVLEEPQLLKRYDDLLARLEHAK